MNFKWQVGICLGEKQGMLPLEFARLQEELQKRNAELAAVNAAMHILQITGAAYVRAYVVVQHNSSIHKILVFRIHQA